MLLTKLELFGFKSFANRVEIRFDKGITAIIGPNGSGKSNIAESMRWVLGEQSAKSLRGAKMEDVIFSGTQVKRQMAYCEVQLTLDNSDRLLPVDYAEVQITRRVYRSGESEYFINRTPCRLRDIVDLFRDTGIGKEGYSIIGQGRIDDILSSKSEDRRAIFEEAAGISKYRARKDEAERKLAATRANLVRIGDIVDELATRLDPLFEQSEVAKQYLKLKEELKAIELNAFLHQYDRAKAKITAQQEQIADLTAREEGLLAKAAELIANAAVEQDAARRMDGLISARQSELLELTRRVEQQDGESRVLTERAERLQQDADDALKLAAEQNQRAESLNQELENLAAQRDETAKKLSDLSVDVQKREQELSSRIDAIAQREEELERRKERIIEAMNRLSSAKVQSSRLQTMMDNLAQREAELLPAIEAAKRDVNEISEEKKEHEEKVRAAAGALSVLQEESEAARKAIEQAAELKAENIAKLRELEREAAALISRENLLREMQRGFEGYYAGVKNLLKDCAKGLVGPGVLGVVAQLMRVPEKLVKPVEYALGAALQNIVTVDENAAKRAIEHLRKNNYGRATFLPLTAIRPRVLTEEERASLKNFHGVLGVASDLVETDPKFKNICENLLGRTVVVEDMASGIALARDTRNAFRIVTLLGDIIHTGGSITGGSAQKKETGLLGRENEIERVQKRIQEIEEEKAKLAEREAQAEQAARAAAAEMERIGRRIQEGRIALAQLAEKGETLELLFNQQSSLLKERLTEQERLRETGEDIKNQLSEIEKLQSSLEDSRQVSEKDAESAQTEIAAMRAEREGLTEQLNAARMEHLSLKKEHEALIAQCERLQKEAAAARAAFEAAKKRNEEAIAQLQELLKKSGRLGETIAAMRKESEERLSQIRESEQKRDESLAHAKELEEQAEECRKEAEALKDSRHQAELAKSKLETELTALQNRIWEEYELTYEGAAAYKTGVSFTSSQRQTDQIRKEIRALGEVNVNAIEDYKNVKARYDELYAQQQDLIKAERDLSVLI
ncbi:MAG: chromosome segregation protein SMC, partial [Christensenellales bacterium]